MIKVDKTENEIEEILTILRTKKRIRNKAEILQLLSSKWRKEESKKFINVYHKALNEQIRNVRTN